MIVPLLVVSRGVIDCCCCLFFGIGVLVLWVTCDWYVGGVSPTVDMISLSMNTQSMPIQFQPLPQQLVTVGTFTADVRRTLFSGLSGSGFHLVGATAHANVSGAPAQLNPLLYV